MLLVHASDESVDVHLTITSITALLEVGGDLVEAATRAAQLERPQELVGLLESRADGEDLVDQILNTLDTVLAKDTLDDGVICDRDTLSINTAETTLVDELTNRLEVGVTIR